MASIVYVRRHETDSETPKIMGTRLTPCQLAGVARIEVLERMRMITGRSICARASSRWRAYVAAGTGLAVTVGIVACGGGNAGGSSTSATSGGKGSVTLGANTELSGSLQVYGLPAAQGLRLGAKSVNAAGGIKVGDKTYRIVIKAADNRSDPSQIVNAARAVATAGAVAALGPDLGAIPSYDVWKQSKIITLTPAFDLQQQLIKDAAGNPLLFSPTVFLQNLYTTNMAQLKALYPHIKTAVILSPNDQQGQGSAEAYKFAAQSEGIKVLGVQTYPVANTDFSSVLTSFKQKHPDLLIAEQTSQQAAAILQQAVQLGVAPYALNDVMTPDQVLKVPGISKITVALPSFAPTFSPAATIPDYKPAEVFGNEQPAGNPGAAIDMYYATRLVAQAMEKAGTVSDTSAIAKALPGQSYTGPFGTCTMTQARELSCETLMQIVKGSQITVYRFPGPDAKQPSAKYVCEKGTCTKQ